MAFQNILVPVDGSETSYAAVAKAAEFAKAFNSKITVVQVLVLDPYIAAEYISASQTNDLIERARTSIIDTLAEVKAKFHTDGVEVETKLLEGQVVHTEIANAAPQVILNLSSSCMRMENSGLGRPLMLFQVNFSANDRNTLLQQQKLLNIFPALIQPA